MAATNWTVIRRDKKTGKLLISELTSKWTYKTALGIATEGTMFGSKSKRHRRNNQRKL